MSNVTICDRCNRILKHPTAGMAKFEIETTRVCLGFVSTNREWKHLCVSCMDDFYEFIRDGKSEEFAVEAREE
jgi:NAD-dependent dihydropyrimidine dehydrogenase PreA subunit